MTEDDTCKSMEAYPMIGGDGQHSYSKNSVYQKRASDNAKGIIKEAVLEWLEVKRGCSPAIFRIADFGCATGPNTFVAVQNIIDSVESKYKTQLGLDSQTPEFQVFFNDHTSNDFNTLFKSLPPESQYHVAAAPGSFYQNVFPSGSIDFAHSSYSINWLSKVPDEVLDESCDAWNGGRIYYGNTPDPVQKAYAAQFEKDINTFLHFRAQEIVKGGLMALSFPCCSDGTSRCEPWELMTTEILGSCIMDLVTKGVLDEEKAKTFNLPSYAACADEFADIVNKNGGFSVQEMKELSFSGRGLPSKASFSVQTRAVLESVIKAHFGDTMDMDELFDLFTKKLEDSTYDLEKFKYPSIFAVLKRK